MIRAVVLNENNQNSLCHILMPYKSYLRVVEVAVAIVVVGVVVVVVVEIVVGSSKMIKMQPSMPVP